MTGFVDIGAGRATLYLGASKRLARILNSHTLPPDLHEILLLKKQVEILVNYGESREIWLIASHNWLALCVVVVVLCVLL